MGLFRKDRKEEKQDKPAHHGVMGAFSELREAERLMEGLAGGDVSSAERFVASVAGDKPLDRATAVPARARIVAYEGHDALETQGITRQPFKEHATRGPLDVHPEAEPVFRLIVPLLS